MEEKETLEAENNAELDYDKKVETAIAAAERLEAANKRSQELMEQQNKEAIARQLGGHAAAGQEQVKPMTEDEKITAETKKYLAGTGYEDMI